FAQPRWDGGFLDGKTIFIYSEQGLGDTIHFVRYLPLVKERGGRIVFACQPALVNLCSKMEAVDRVVPDTIPPSLLPVFDVQAPLLSLPGIFGTTIDNIPAHVPYL